jgi:hypothetical protein
VRGSKKNQPPPDETRSGQVSSSPVNILPQVLGTQGQFFHLTIFLWDWPVVIIPLGARSDRSLVEAA